MTDKPAAKSTNAAQPPRWTAPSLEDMLDMEIEAWRPEVGDVIIGRVLRISEGGSESAFGAYPILTIQADRDGMCVNVHSFHSVLRRELSRQEVGEGDRVGIKYLGQVKGGDFGKFENYRVIKDHAIMEPAPSERRVVTEGNVKAQAQASPDIARNDDAATQEDIPF